MVISCNIKCVIKSGCALVTLRRCTKIFRFAKTIMFVANGIFLMSKIDNAVESYVMHACVIAAELIVIISFFVTVC